MKRIITCFLLIFYGVITAQVAPNFTVTDTEGKVHKLYEDYLDKGKVVVFKIFFVDCPPCNAIAPAFQQKYLEWGSGGGNVQFIEITNKVGDNNNRVKQYKSKHSLTLPSISSEGGALDVVKPYMDGTLGQWSGTPFFAVIKPNRTMNYDALFNNLNSLITAAGGTMTTPPNNVGISFGNGFQMPVGVHMRLKSATNSSINYNITQMTNGSHQFSYPSASIPEIIDPYFELESTPSASFTTGLSVIDLVAIKNHIVGTNKFTLEINKLASDINGDSKITVADLVVLQKVIAGINATFPNNVPSYRMFPSTLPFSVPAQGGGNISLVGEIYKMGNVK